MLLPVRTLGRGRDLINENGVYMLRFVLGHHTVFTFAALVSPRQSIADPL